MRYIFALSIFLCMVMVTGLTACKPQDYMYSAESLSSAEYNDFEYKQIHEEILKRLSDKYKDSFSIESLEREDANMEFYPDKYKAKVFSDTYSSSFTVRVNSDGEDLVDDYPCLYWDTQIKSLVNESLAEVPEIQDIKWEIVYILSRQTWNSSDNIQEYLQYGDTYLDLTITLPDSIDISTATKQLNLLLESMRRNQLQFSVQCNVGTNMIIFSEKYGQETVTEEKIMHMLEQNT